MSSPPKNDAAEEPTSSSDRSKWSPERKTSQHSSSLAGKPKCPEEEEVIHLLAIRSLMDQLYDLLSGGMPSINLSISKGKQLEIITERKDKLFHTMKEVHRNVNIPTETTMPLLSFLSTESGSCYQKASKAAHTTSILAVRAAAVALGCQQAHTWLEILTNGDDSVDENTEISALVESLKGKMQGRDVMEKIRSEIKDEASNIEKKVLPAWLKEQDNLMAYRRTE